MKQIAAILMALVAIAAQGREITYEVGPFDKLSQMGDVNVVYRSVPDSVGIVRYESDTDFSDALEISNNKGKLTIKELSGHGLGQVPTIHVYSDYISQVRSEGNSTVIAELSASTPTLSVRLVGNGRIVCENVSSPEVKASISTGNGDIVLRGKCTQASFDLAGTGVIQADGLEAQSVKCTVLGTGSIGCWAVDNLDVRGIGTTKIYYRGEPKVKKVGGARLSPIYEEPQSGASDRTVVTAHEEAEDSVTEADDNTEEDAVPDDEEEDDEEDLDD
jgi:hypothetical protein